ncbi:MAG TPA: helix-turn-helix transcriptional regulator [Flavobacteriaceae bacterium]|nr:helix-turn-helix transcriptional regulator [Flavobacteriaceae bacterium]
MENLYKQIGKNIKIARTSKGLSQKELADKLPFSRSSLSNMEVGRHKITIEQLIEISNITGYQLSSFIQDEGYKLPRYSKKKIERIYNEFFGEGYWEKQYRKRILSFVKLCLKSYKK